MNGLAPPLFFSFHRAQPWAVRDGDLLTTSNAERLNRALGELAAMDHNGFDWTDEAGFAEARNALLVLRNALATKA